MHKKIENSIASILNSEVPQYIRWCTPSVLLKQERVKDIYETDVSNSMRFFNVYKEGEDIFLPAKEFAAKVHHADKTLFVVNGSTGSNFIVFRMLSLEKEHPLVLISKNIHHSAINAMEILGINFIFMPSWYISQFETILPPTPEQVEKMLTKYPNADAIFITSPNYEGITADIRSIVNKVRKINKEVKIIIDEAWGAHLDFSEELPQSAMEAGADISIQSAHKQGGALQQTSMIHWKEDRVDPELMYLAFEEYSTTSPSFNLLASIDSANHFLFEHKDTVNALIEKSKEFKKMLFSQIPQVALLENYLTQEYIKYNRSFTGDYDTTKIVLALNTFNKNGFDIKRALEAEYKIIAEKGGLNTIEFITTFQLLPKHIQKTVNAIFNLLKRKDNKYEVKNHFVRPFILQEEKPVIDLQYARRIARTAQSKVPIENSVGRIAAERIEIYPPGIPLTLEGFRITKTAIQYLMQVKKLGGQIVARDPNLKYIYCL